VASARLQMVHLCTIERDANAGHDERRGNPSPPDWQPHSTNVPCRGWTTTGKERAEDEAIIDFENIRLIVPIGTDVTARDRVGDVTDRGDTIMKGPIGIHAVIRQRDFVELILVRISG
jgi:hypothetical protein